MNARRGGLGRGLGALIPTGPAGSPGRTAPPASGQELGDPVPAGPPPAAGDGAQGAGAPFPDGTYLASLPPDSIRPNPRQPRLEFDEQALVELEASLREVGMLQPVVVRPVPGGSDAFELVMGERRWRAAQRAGLTTIPAIVRQTDDDAMLRDALLENLHRAELNPLEEAAAYQQLLQEFGATHEELAVRIGRSRSQVSNTIRLLQLPPAVQRRVAAGVLSAGHARALLSLPDAARQDELASRIVAEGLSVRTVEEIVATDAGPARAARRRRVDPGDDEAIARGAVLGGRVADRLDTRVRVELGRSRGRLVIEVADVDDLARIVQLIAGPSVG